MSAIRRQIKASEETADELLMRNHRAAMLCCDLEELVAIVLGLAQIVYKNVDAVGKKNPPDEIQEQEWSAACHELATVFEKTGQCIAMFKKMNFDVAGADEFDANYYHVLGMASINLTQLRIACEGIKLGRGRPWREVVRELRDRHRTGSTGSSQQETLEFPAIAGPDRAAT